MYGMLTEVLLEYYCAVGGSCALFMNAFQTFYGLRDCMHAQAIPVQCVRDADRGAHRVLLRCGWQRRPA